LSGIKQTALLFLKKTPFILLISAIFLWREIGETCWTQSEQVKNGPFERVCRWFHLFFIDFELFYFLLRITPEKSNLFSSDITKTCSRKQ
jgi:hypothetical protein